MMETATFAGGCFWCTEAVFKMLRGVNKVNLGYSGAVYDWFDIEGIIDLALFRYRLVQYQGW